MTVKSIQPAATLQTFLLADTSATDSFGCFWFPGVTLCRPRRGERMPLHAGNVLNPARPTLLLRDESLVSSKPRKCALANGPR